MATLLTGTGLGMRASQQTIGLRQVLSALAVAFNKANAARHVYDGLVSFKVPHEEAVRRTVAMIYEGRPSV